MYECVCIICIFEYNTQGTEGRPGAVVQLAQYLHCVRSPGFDPQHCRHKSGMMAPNLYLRTWEAEGEVWRIWAQPETLSMEHKLSGTGDESIKVCGLDDR